MCEDQEPELPETSETSAVPECGEDPTAAGFAYTMELITGKYRLPILYCLTRHGVVRFNEMKRLLGGDITFRTLSNTLKGLEQDGLILRHEYPQIPPKVEYSLTERGKSLRPVLKALCQWGNAHKDEKAG